MHSNGEKKNENGRKKPVWGTLLKAAVTLGILGWFGMTLDWAELGRQFTRADVRWLLAGLAVFSLVLVGTSLRWQTLLKVQSVALPFKPVLALTMIGLFFNAFLPGAVGGDVVKIFYILKYAPNRKARAALSILMDRFFGLCVLLILAVATFPLQVPNFSQHPELRAIMWSLAGFLAATMAGVAVLMWFPFHIFPDSWCRLWKKAPKHEVIESLMEGFRQHGREPRLTLLTIGYAALVHFLGFFVGYCLARGLGLDANLFQMATILAVVYILMNLPISISGHGMREFGAVLMFSIYGLITVNPTTHAGQEPAIAFSLLLFGIYLVWGLIGGLVYMTFQHQKQTTVPEE